MLQSFLLLAGSAIAATLTPHYADIVIVGAGPAGLVLANRLSANPRISVQLLEAGPDPTGVEEIYRPADCGILPGTQYTWNYTSTPQKVLGGLTPSLAQGHALGGGTSVNYMNYGRGAPSVFDEWAEISGDDGWRWENLLPYFMKSTKLDLSNTSYAPVTDSSVYGNGPVSVSYSKDLDAFTPVFMDAFKAEGVPEIDLCAGYGIGVTYGLLSILQSNATRSSAWTAYGYPLAGRKNVGVLHGAWVKKINFEGKRAVSVTYVTAADGKSHTISFKELIVSGGGINTPKLLMLSGVGPRAHLEKLGIDVVADIPHIGRKLYDHHTPTIELNMSTTLPTYGQWSVNKTLYNELEEEYVKYARGPFAAPDGMGAGMIRVPDDVLINANATFHLNLPKDRPHIMYQYELAPFLYNEYPNSNIISISIILVTPEASGHMRLKSSDFRDDPLLYSNYYGSAGDKACILWAYKHGRELFRSKGPDSIIINELFPGENVTSDADLWTAIGQSSGTYYHPVATVPMGKVVDKNFRIKGLKGIRVVDSSIIPVIPTAWTEASVYAIAERAADVIMRDCYD